MKVNKFGIIGCGMISRFHARAIKSLGAELVACYDQFPAAAERLASEFGCKAYQDFKEFLADPDIQIVTIGTPSGAHLDPAVASAQAGKHVIVEKPLEVTVARCDEIIDACNKAGVTLSTVFPSRFHQSSIQLKKAIESGRFGKLTLGDAIVKWYRTQQYYDSGVWRGTWKLDGGGALMNQAIHSVDLLVWLMGDVAEVRPFALRTARSGSSKRRPPPIPDISNVLKRPERWAPPLSKKKTLSSGTLRNHAKKTPRFGNRWPIGFPEGAAPPTRPRSISKRTRGSLPTSSTQSKTDASPLLTVTKAEKASKSYAPSTNPPRKAPSLSCKPERALRG